MQSSSLSQEFDAERRLVTKLRDELNSTAERIDMLISERRETGMQIAEKLRQVKKLREERDTITGEVKKHKSERNETVVAIKQKIREARLLYKQRDEISKKCGITRMPAQLQEEIRKIEYKIETEAPSFETEQKWMKRIKGLKKQLAEAQVVGEVISNVRTVEKNIKELKAQGEEKYTDMQTKADESQKKHEALIALLKDVDQLRVKEDGLLKDIEGLKKAYADARQKLEAELLKLNVVGKQLHDIKAEGERNREKRIAEQLESKTRSVEEKLKKGEKLTTQDLLAWQAKNA